MMVNRFAGRAALLGAIAAMTLAAPKAFAVNPIQVVVNRSPVAFSGTQPMEQNGRVLVPLRGVFEAIGATVDYDAATRVIHANKGLQTVVLPLGSATAMVNGQTRTLSQPAQVVNGTTLVPLRFVAESLGAYVEWHEASSTVDITTEDSHLANLPPPASRVVTGQLTGVYTDTNPMQITVRVNGVNTTIPIDRYTSVVRSAPNQPDTPITVSQLTVGDQVTVRRDASGVAQAIASNYGEIRGTLKSVRPLANGDREIVLNDGTRIVVPADTPMTMNGRRVAFSDIMPDEDVLIRTDPATAMATRILVNPSGGSRTGGGTTGAGAPSVTSFRVQTRGPVRAGQRVAAIMTGTPGGEAAFSIPGVVDSVAMTETRPGEYHGSYTVPQGVSVRGAAVLGQLTVDGQSAPLIQAADLLNIQSVAPTVAEVSPLPDTSVQSDRPLIYGSLNETGGAAIDPNRVRIAIDGRDVSDEATVTPKFFNVRPNRPLAPGSHTVRVQVADEAGNVSSRDWSFRVTQSQVVRDFSTDVAPDSVLNAGSRVRFSLRAEPGGQANVVIPGVAREIPLTETSPGVYSGSYVVRRGQNASNIPPTVRFVRPDGTTLTQSLPYAIRVAAGAPEAPTIIDPAEGANVGRTVSVRGMAQPGATVQVKVDYTSRGLGGLLNVNGSSATEQVVADSSGRWEVNDLPLSGGGLLAEAGDTQYHITATAVNAAGQSSPPSQLDVRGGRVYAHYR